MILKPCGTYAAYQRHKKAGEAPCEACRAASAEYRREHRRARPELLQSEYVRRWARERALRRLAKRHPVEFRELYRDELSKDERTRT